MRKNFLLGIMLFALAGAMQAQTPEAGGELRALLPDGVKANIGTERRPFKEKNLVVAGSPEKGYLAFFAATDNEHGEELWATDGTEAGTYLVKDIIPGSASSNVCYLARFNDKVVFSAYTDDYGTDLWISDGTEDGTHLVKDVNELGDSNPRGFTQVNENQFIFAAQNYDSQMAERGAQWWLWVSDGTEEGTQLICDKCDVRYPGSTHGSMMWWPFVRVGRKVFFKADNVDGTTGEELWVTDGTTEGTIFLKDINTEPLETGTAGSSLDHLANFYNEKLFFKAHTLESGNEPWASDGTPEGTYQIYDCVPTKDENGKGQGGNLTMVGSAPYKGKFYFRCKTNEFGSELGCTDCEQGNFRAFDINVNVPTSSKNSSPDPGVEFDGVYMFCANSGEDPTIPTNYGGELHYTDGEKVYLQSNMAPGIQCNWVKELTVASGSLYWWNESDQITEYKTKLFRINSKDEFPVRVTNLFPDGDQIHSLRNLDGDLIFATENAVAQIYCYHYRKPGFDPETETDNLEPEYRTRAEMGLSAVENVSAGKASDVIYPNPATTSFNIKTDCDVKQVVIYDIAGRMVVSQTGLEGKTVNVEQLSKGIYEVVIYAEDGAIYTSRLIKK